ncbi:MAG: hypothetical protein JRI23_27780 [Deltaproteobacteria bacterium]|nr:hypothetical protein [Deltaproteobacteria bacterium]MBW2535889.1 hypothetical protein [Deltaproteobacteria bacterium]
MNLRELQRSSLAELEAIYAEPNGDIALAGRFRGIHLVRLDRPDRRRRLAAASYPFQVVPFGIDFDTHRWFFLHPVAQMGRFEALPGRSRWRDADVVRLHYANSGLPLFVRGLLYDEVKPLSDDLCLGMGGINDVRGRGDHFFFALERAR